MMWPPTPGSKTVTAIGTCSRWCSGGLKSPIRSANTAKARSTGGVDDDLLVHQVGDGFQSWLLLSRLVNGPHVPVQCRVPVGVELVAHRGDAPAVESVHAVHLRPGQSAPMGRPTAG